MAKIPASAQNTKKIMVAAYRINKQRKMVLIAFPVRRARKQHIVKSTERLERRREMND
jgi:hypothetical protein